MTHVPQVHRVHRTLKIFRRTDSILLVRSSLPCLASGRPLQWGAPLGSSCVPVSLVVELPELGDPEGAGDPEGSRPIPVFIQFESKFHTELKEPPLEAAEATVATRARCDSMS